MNAIFRVEYRKYQDAENVFSHEVSADEMKYAVTGLEAGAKYEARVICVTSAGAPVAPSELRFSWQSVTVLGECLSNVTVLGECLSNVTVLDECLSDVTVLGECLTNVTVLYECLSDVTVLVWLGVAGDVSSCVTFPY